MVLLLWRGISGLWMMKLEQLGKARTPPSEEPRASIILAEKDSRSWGGIGWETFHIGEPGFVHSG